MHGVERLYLQEYLDEVMWRHNECRIEHKCPKKEMKLSRKNAFKKILNLLQASNMDKLDYKIRESEDMNKVIQQREKMAKHKAKFNTDDFIVSHNRIKNRLKLFDEEFVSLQSRSTQTDASSFDYKLKRKIFIVENETEKLFDSLRQLENKETQTEWSPYADVLIQSKSDSKKDYNLRTRTKKTK
ncbi:unnamed protein product [Brachionus calyciflorus]|uniref:Uncharacterized protein n=1 Tax=Brachionus calyciflorus TaxID=104777 RepID=A0A814K1P9_9BILA|nr:unnamed protein product [Brachionus calyciflorus]